MKKIYLTPFLGIYPATTDVITQSIDPTGGPGNNGDYDSDIYWEVL